MTRDPKTDPQPGDVIRWQTRPKENTFVAIVTDRSPHTVSWVDVNPNGYADSETARVAVWQKHGGIQSGTVLFVAPDAYGVVGEEG